MDNESRPLGEVIIKLYATLMLLHDICHHEQA